MMECFAAGPRRWENTGQTASPVRASGKKAQTWKRKFRRLEKELRETQEEREILKKAMAILSKSPKMPIG